jgi:glycosyltransferase involved in cell wall biosynthesis
MRIVPASRYTLLHAHDWLVAPAALALRQAFQLPLVVTVHATEYGRNAGLHTPLQHRIHAHEQQLVQEADRIICCSRFMAREVARLFAIPEEKVTVIENGVVPENIAAAKLSGADRMNYARDDEELLFFVGRLVKEKGLEVLLAALAKVFPVRNVRAVIAGKGPMFAELERQARGYGIRERINFAGFMADDERNRLLATADLVVLPSLYEPFGIAVLEAMAAGATVVVSDVGGMSEVVRHGIDGWKVPAGDPAALAAAILMLLDDRKLRHELGRNARDQVVSAYSWSELAGKTKALYRKTWESAETNLAAGRGGQNG